MTKKYNELTEDQKKKAIAAVQKYTKEKTARTTIKMSKEFDAAMMKYIEDNGYRSKNNFILELIREKIDYYGK